MKRRGLKRLRGCGCNSAKIKRVYKRWRESYDRSKTYDLKQLPRKKTERFDPDKD
jgi:hypothetical protein